MRLGTAAASYHGEGSFGHKAPRKAHGPGPAMNLTPLSPDQLEFRLRQLREDHRRGTVLSPRTLMVNRGLSGLPLEQVLAAWDLE